MKKLNKENQKLVNKLRNQQKKHLTTQERDNTGETIPYDRNVSEIFRYLELEENIKLYKSELKRYQQEYDHYRNKLGVR